MKIGVCLKQVPDTAAKISVKSDGSGVAEENIKYVISPYDEYAVEEALRTKEKLTAGEVVAFSVGPKRAQEALRNALAMGADRAVHVSTEGKSVDPLAVAKLLAAQLKEEGIEILFTGKMAADEDNAQVSQMVAELLSWPHVTVVSKLELTDGNKKARVERDVEGGTKQIWEVTLPAVFAANKGLNEPRYASLKGIMAAKKKPMKEAAATAEAPRVLYSGFRLPPSRKAGKLFKDDPKAAVAQVVKLLRDEAKVI